MEEQYTIPEVRERLQKLKKLAKDDDTFQMFTEVIDSITDSDIAAELSKQQQENNQENNTDE